MGLKKRKHEAEHRAGKKAKAGGAPECARGAGPRVPCDWDIVRDLFLSEVGDPGSSIFNAGPGSFILTSKGWRTVNPFSGLIRMDFEVPEAHMVLEALFGLAKSVGHYNEMTRSSLEGARPPEDGSPSLTWGTPGRFKAAITDPDGPDVDGLAERTVRTPWMPKDRILFVGGAPEELGRLVAHWSGEAWRYGVLVWSPSLHMIALKDGPATSLLPWV